MRILLIRLGQLGDTVFTSSVIDGLRQHYGESVDITFLVKEGSHVLFESDPRISVQTITNRRLPVVLNTSKWRCVIHSWLRPYDLILNMQIGDIANDIMRVLRVTGNTGRKLGHPYSQIDTSNINVVHAVIANIRLAQSLLPEVDFSQSAPLLFPPADTLALLEKKGLAPKRYLVLNPGNSHVSRGKKKNHRAWPMPHWRALIAQLGKHPETRVLINCGPGEEALIEELGKLPDNVILDSGSQVMDLIAYLDQAALVVSSDTGTVHLAAALNTPLLGLYGPTDERNTGAYPSDKPIFTILHTDISCRPCTNTPRFNACNNNLCMQEISPERVFEQICQVVELQGSRHADTTAI